MQGVLSLKLFTLPCYVQTWYWRFLILIQNSRKECFEFANLDGIYVGEERRRTIFTLWKVITLFESKQEMTWRK